jgi:Ca2+-binding RTX toxin-like protein
MVVALAAMCVMVPAAQAHYLIAYQAKTDGPNNLFTYDPTVNSATDVEAGMAPGTSPSINNGIVPQIAFQANTGNLDITGTGDTGLAMAAGTSPSIDAAGNVAFQGSNGNLWTYAGNGNGTTDTGAAMMAGTSPSIQPGLGFTAPPPPTSVIRGGPDDDRLDSGAGSDLIRGGAGNDVAHGGPGRDVTQGGPGKDRIYGGRGSDLLHGNRGDDVLYGGLGKDRIVDHRGATTAYAGSGNNLVDVADGRGDDLVVCTPGTITDLLADRRDRLARSCHERVPQPRSVR